MRFARRRAVALVVVLASPLARATPPALDADQQPPRDVPGAERYARGRIAFPDADPEGTRGLLTLTFDDGPSAATTGAILEELARRGVRATFFVNAYRLAGRSENAERQRALLRDAAAAGHAIGNHTFSHERLSDLSAAAQEKQILDGETGIARVLGERPYLFRPPFGRMAEGAAKLLSRRGYTIVLWNISSEDPYLRTPERVLAQVMEEIRREEGGVVLFHDTHEWTARALPRFFDALAEENCRRVAAGDDPLLLVDLDRFFRPRYGVPLSAPALAERAEADRIARRRIAEGCGGGAVPKTANKASREQTP